MDMEIDTGYKKRKRKQKEKREKNGKQTELEQESEAESESYSETKSKPCRIRPKIGIGIGNEDGFVNRTIENENTTCSERSAQKENNPRTNAPTGRVNRNWTKSGGKAPWPGFLLVGEFAQVPHYPETRASPIGYLHHV